MQAWLSWRLCCNELQLCWRQLVSGALPGRLHVDRSAVVLLQLKWNGVKCMRARPGVAGGTCCLQPHVPMPACSAKESIGGGDKSNHGRRKQLMGHVR